MASTTSEKSKMQPVKPLPKVGCVTRLKLRKHHPQMALKDRPPWDSTLYQPTNQEMADGTTKEEEEILLCRENYKPAWWAYGQPHKMRIKLCHMWGHGASYCKANVPPNNYRIVYYNPRERDPEDDYYPDDSVDCNVVACPIEVPKNAKTTEFLNGKTHGSNHAREKVRDADVCRCPQRRQEKDGEGALICCRCEVTGSGSEKCHDLKPRFRFCHDVGPAPIYPACPNNYRLSYLDGSCEYRQSDIICPVAPRGTVLRTTPVHAPRPADSGQCQKKVPCCKEVRQGQEMRTVCCNTPKYYVVV